MDIFIFCCEGYTGSIVLMLSIGVNLLKRIALINDLSGFGKCSLTAAIPVVSVMGIQACPVPTAILSGQGGFKDNFFDDYTEKMAVIIEKWKKMDVSFDGIYSGYMAHYNQIENVMGFLDAFKNEINIYLCDPVMADNGKPYIIFNDKFLKSMKLLTLEADIITPNLTELCLLSDTDYFSLVSQNTSPDYLNIIAGICRKLLAKTDKKQTIIVTGIITDQQGEKYVGNLAVSREEQFYIQQKYIGKSFSGTGDLFASVVCGSVVKGFTVKQAVEKAAVFLQHSIQSAVDNNIEGNHGVDFERYLYELTGENNL